MHYKITNFSPSNNGYNIKSLYLQRHLRSTGLSELTSDTLCETLPTNPFFNSWFLDFEQLMLIVKESNSNDELLARLLETKYVTTGSYNFYRERRMVRMMNGNKG